MHERNKWAFWGVALAAAAVVLAPSTLLLDALRGYQRFLEGFEPPLVRPVKVHSLPHGGGAEGVETKLEFVEFKLKDSRAKEVLLVGDFNAWREGTLRLARKGRGDWELTLPLPKGRYRYVFVVDGQERADPKASGGVRAGRPVSVREVR